MKKPSLTVLLLLLTACFPLVAQTELGSLGPSRVFPPSPEPARMALYGAYGVSYFTGKPQIGIPIYTIKTSGLEVPVSLNYESSGVKVDELASWAGTGWMLSGGGMITRVVVDKPDEWSGGYLEQTTIPYLNTGDLNYYTQTAFYHTIDTEPDKYFYNFNGRSGEFTYDEAKNIIQCPVSALKITRLTNGFEITDEQGNLYEFKMPETSWVLINNDGEAQPSCPTSWWLTKITAANRIDAINFAYSEDLDELEDKPTYSAAYGDAYELISDGLDYALARNTISNSHYVTNRSWKPQRLDSITFTNGKVVINRLHDRLDGGSSRVESIDIFNIVNGTYSKLRSVKFTIDYFHYSGFYSNTLISYSQNYGKYRLKLTGLEERDAKGLLVDTYKFEYNETELPFRGSYQQDYWGYFNGVTQNDVSLTLLPTQQTDDLIHTVGGADRTPNEQFMKAGILTKITYPTGGYTNFNWEAHRYQYSAQTVETHVEPPVVASGNNDLNDPHPSQSSTFTMTEADGNVAVTVDIPPYPDSFPAYDDQTLQDLAEDSDPTVTIKNLTTGAVVFTRKNINNTFNYHENASLSLPAGTYQIIAECYVNSVNAHAQIAVSWHSTSLATDVRQTGGLRIADIQNYNYDDALLYKETYKYGDGETGYGKLSLPPEYLNTLSHNKIFKYWIGLSGNGGSSQFALTTTRKLYRAESVAVLNLASGSPVTYPVVTKYIGDGLNNTGRTIYRYRASEDFDVHYLPDGEPLVRRFGWLSPVVEDEETHANNGAAYVMIKKVHNDYTELGHTLSQIVKLGMPYENVNLGWLGLQIDDFYFSSYNYHTAVLQLTSTTVQEFDSNETRARESSKTIAYDDSFHAFPISETTTGSKGEVSNVVTKYAFQQGLLGGLNATQSDALTRMVAKNMLAPAIEKVEYRNTVQLQRYRTNYKIWDVAQDIVKPESIEFQTQANPTEIRVVFEAYDQAGNLQQQRKAKDFPVSYIWDYSSTYPVAEVKNAANGEIAYTSFESDGVGNWNVPFLTRDNTTAMTGLRSYTITTGSISKTGLNSGNVYTVSYWKKLGSAGSFTVSGTVSIKTGVTVNDWTYYEHTVTGVTSVTVSGTSGKIDELRLHPVASQMVTNTYSPFVGPLEAIDANNTIVFYKYDDFGRLISLLDTQGNLLKTYSYSYRK
jgi:YD repeat-containing protein